MRGQPLRARALRGVMPRAGLDVAHAVEQVRPICDAVRERGVEALLELTERFDGVRPASIRVPEEALDRALAGLPDDVRAGLEEAIARTRLVHGQQKPSGHVTRVVPGGTVTQRWLPVGRVGLYVPGGVAVYPSSVVMNVVPAQAAGVESIAVTSPAQRENPAEFAGMPHPTILAACALLGVARSTGSAAPRRWRCSPTGPPTPTAPRCANPPTWSPAPATSRSLPRNACSRA